MVRIREFIPFPKGISLKVNVIAQLKFELTYNDVVAQHVNHYSMGTFLIFNVLGAGL